jgi:hypothetical protein
MKPVFLVAAMLLLGGCADHVSLTQAASRDPVGFWHGLWHGAILLFAWIVSLFDGDVGIYAIYNDGGGYDFGFVLGATSPGVMGLCASVMGRLKRSRLPRYF